jgi:GTP-binding protein
VPAPKKGFTSFTLWRNIISVRPLNQRFIIWARRDSVGLEIAKEKTQFLLGLASHQKVQEWVQQNPDIAGFAFVGRSNVGKSSLINALWGKVAKVSKTPGRTQEINVFSFYLNPPGQREKLFGPYYLFDLPGYGHAEVPQELLKTWRQMVTAFFAELSPNVLLVNIRDSRHPQERADLVFEEMLKGSSRKVFVVFSKIDKLLTQSERLEFSKKRREIEGRFRAQAFIDVSAIKSTGIKDLEKMMADYLSCLSKA